MDNLNKILKEEAIFEGHSVEAREAIMEHVKRGVPLCDSIFRTHSDAYFETFNLARKLYKEGLLEGLDWESVEMLESNIGETAVVDGEVVYLDVPYLCEDEDEEKKIFFVKVGDGRDSMTVKTKAKNKSEALKKIRDEHPKERVSLDTNHDQGKPAEMLESVELDESHSVKDQIYDRYEELSGHRDNPEVKKHLAKADKCWQDGDVQGCMDALRAGEKLVAPKRESKDWKKQAADDASARLDNHKKKMPSVWKQMHKDAAELEKSKKRKEQMNEDSELDHIIRLLKS